MKLLVTAENPPEGKEHQLLISPRRQISSPNRKFRFHCNQCRLCGDARRSHDNREDARQIEGRYHLSDLDKVNFVIGNIQNHLDGVGP